MTEINLPKLGESIVGATVVQWFKKVGDPIAVDEPLLEVTTDKVNSEIPSPIAGVLQEILVKVDEEVEVGAPLAIVAPSVAQVATKEKSASPAVEREESFSPAVLRMAQMEGIDMATLQRIKGTGEGGRVTKKDIEQFLKSPQPSPCSKKGENKPPCAKHGAEERVPLTGMRKAIAANMVRSFYEAPHASLVSEIDMTDVMTMIHQQRTLFLETHGVKLTVTSFVIQALTKAMQQFPLLNASLEGDTIVCKRYINLGIAVNIEQGLVVPVLKNCQDRNLVSIAQGIADLSTKARRNQLSHDDVQGSTITMTNFGMTGALIGTPIIHYPEVAIIGIGAVQKRVVVREDNALAIRQMAYFSMTFDHRVVDGIYVCDFLALLKKQLESLAPQE